MLDFIKIEFGLLSAQKRKVQIYIFLHLSKGKKLSCPFPLLDFLPAKEAVWELKGIFCFKATIKALKRKPKF